MRIAIAQLDYTIGAFESNYAKIAAAARRARNEKAELVVFSELATTGYPPRDLLERESFIDHNLRLLGKIAELSDEDLGIIVGFVDRNPDQGGKRLLNGVALCHLGEVVARRHKCLLPTYDVFDEIRHFEPAKSVEPVLFRGIRFGLTICEDAWNDPGFQDRQLYDRNPVEELVTRGAELLINISASPFAIGKPGFRKDLFREAATRHRRYNLCINQVGGHDELVFDGHSLGFDPDGSLVFQAHDFAEDFLVVNLEEDAIRGGSASRPGALREVSRSQVEQAYKALVLGLGDYTAKCGFSRVVLGLSGGIDSALTAALAAEALGPENVIGVAMPARHSSEHSLEDAAELASKLGISYRVIPIDPIFQSYLDALEDALAGHPADVTEENLQARIRGGVLMALSNKLRVLLLTTGNKSELAVGYCTLYGDMCGGLAVLSDVPKTMVYQLASFVNSRAKVIPESTMKKPPSAELAPDQRDEDSLPPYDILDRVLEAHVEDNMSREEIAALGFDPKLVDEVVSMVERNEYKRRQAPPGLKISGKAFGFGRRLPIAADYRGIGSFGSDA